MEVAILLQAIIIYTNTRSARDLDRMGIEANGSLVQLPQPRFLG